MKSFLLPSTILVATLALASASTAQDAPRSSELPKVCDAMGASAGMKDIPMMKMPPGQMPEIGMEFMRAMETMHKDMMPGMHAKDPDVAFYCSMIPHHRSAIDMAQAVLKKTTDSSTKTLANKIIADQTKEIAEMRTQLDELEKRTQ